MFTRKKFEIGEKTGKKSLTFLSDISLDVKGNKTPGAIWKGSAAELLLLLLPDLYLFIPDIGKHNRCLHKNSVMSSHWIFFLFLC